MGNPVDKLIFIYILCFVLYKITGSGGITADADVASHNNPMEMMPTAGMK